MLAPALACGGGSELALERWTEIDDMERAGYLGLCLAGSGVLTLFEVFIHMMS